MIQKFVKRPVVIEAVQYTGLSSLPELINFCPELEQDDKESTIIEFHIKTLEGNMKVSVNDWIIKGVNGEFYPCKPDIFEKSYAPFTPVDLG